VLNEKSERGEVSVKHEILIALICKRIYKNYYKVGLN
jgi:hypothetical protein